MLKGEPTGDEAMQCDYCGRDILGEPLAVEALPEAFSPLTDLPSGYLNFCGEDCFHAYMEEAGAASLPEEEAEERAAGALAEEVNVYR
jgi:hypothetical protein